MEAEAGGDWCDALFAMQEAISQARSELAQADTADRPLPLVSHEIETRCFDQCISSMKELIQALEPVSSEVTEVAALLEDTKRYQGMPNDRALKAQHAQSKQQHNYRSRLKVDRLHHRPLASTTLLQADTTRAANLQRLITRNEHRRYPF